MTRRPRVTRPAASPKKPMSDGRPIPDDLLSAFRDGELSGAEAEAAERLLEDSSDARAEIEDYQVISDLIRGMRQEKAPADLRASVMRRIEREALLAPPPVRRASRLRGRLWLAGTLLVGSAAGVLIAFGPSKRLPPSGGAKGAVAMSAPAARSTRESPPAAPSTEMVLADAVSPATVNSPSDRGETPLPGLDVAVAGPPPAGALPGDMYSYADVADDGQVAVVAVTVVDMDLGLNQLQYLLAKNSISPQPVGFNDFSDYGAEAATATDAELGLYVVSDRNQIDAALSELRQRPDLFLNVELEGVLTASTANALYRDASPSSAPAPDATDFTEAIRARGIVPPAPEPEAAETTAAGQARASIPAERFQTQPAPDVKSEKDVASDDASAPNSLQPTEAEKPSLAEALDSDASQIGRGYQQLVNVSKEALEKQLRESQKAASQQKLSSATGDGASYYSAPDAMVRGAPTRLTENRARWAGDGVRQDLNVPSGLKKLRMLVVLEAQPSARAKAAAPLRAPVEAPQPTRGKG